MARQRRAITLAYVGNLAYLDHMRRPGEHARTKTRQIALRVLIVLAVLIAGGIVGALTLGWQSDEFVLLELTLIAAMLGIDRLLIPVLDRWDRGATGEETVGEFLAPLADEGWHAFHDVATGRGNIDHVVIGPGGLFTIETKSHRGRISPNRIDEGMLKQAYAQRKWVERVTGAQADALLVFSQAYLLRAVTRRRGVLVLPGRMLQEHLRRRGHILSPPEIEDLERRLAAATA